MLAAMKHLAAVAALVVLVIMLLLMLEVMVVLEEKFHQHTYQIHSHKMIQDHHLVNS